MAKAVEVAGQAAPEPATVLAPAPASASAMPLTAAPSLRPAATRTAVDPAKATAFGKARTSARPATELGVHLVQATATQVTRTPVGVQMRKEPPTAAGLAEATGMVAGLVVAAEPDEVKPTTMDRTARAMPTAVAPGVEVVVVMTAGSAAVPVADRGTAVVLLQVTTMVAATGQHLKVTFGLK